MLDASLDPLVSRCRFINWVLSEASKVLLSITKPGLNPGTLLCWIRLRPPFSQFLFKRGISEQVYSGLLTTKWHFYAIHTVSKDWNDPPVQTLDCDRSMSFIQVWQITASIPTLITSLPARQVNLKPNGCNYGLIRHPRSLHLERGGGKGSSVICNSPGSINVNGPSFTQWRTRNHYVWLNCQICIHIWQTLAAEIADFNKKWHWYHIHNYLLLHWFKMG